MTHYADPVFWHHFRQLPQTVQRAAVRKYRLLRADPRHPSLHFKRVGRRPEGELWSARVNLAYRALALRQETSVFLWIWIGHHDDYDRLIAS